MQKRMESYPRVAVERAMKVQELILRAMAKKVPCSQAAHIARLSDRQMRRLRWRYETYGYDGLLDRRRGVPSERRVPLALAEQVLCLYREKYYDLNVRHFHEKLNEQHGIVLELHLGEAGPSGSLDWWPRSASGALHRVGYAVRCLACCFISTAASIDDFRTIAGTT